MLALAAWLLLSAQEVPRIEETIVVTAERLEQRLEESTAAVTVLRAEELQRLPAANLGDVLELVPGLQLLAVNPGAPPMIATSCCPARIDSAALVAAWNDVAHARTTLKASTVFGMPVPSTISRATFGAAGFGTACP